MLKYVHIYRRKHFPFNEEEEKWIVIHWIAKIYNTVRWAFLHAFLRRNWGEKHSKTWFFKKENIIITTKYSRHSWTRSCQNILGEKKIILSKIGKNLSQFERNTLYLRTYSLVRYSKQMMSVLLERTPHLFSASNLMSPLVLRASGSASGSAEPPPSARATSAASATGPQPRPISEKSDSLTVFWRPPSPRLGVLKGCLFF